MFELTVFILVCSAGLSGCSSWLGQRGLIVLDVQDKTKTNVVGHDLPSDYLLGSGFQELEKFEKNCRQAIKASQLDGSEEVVFENMKKGIHGQVEFKKCDDNITRIYQY